VVVDLGADFRLAEPAAWQRWYSGKHAGSWPYGLPELPGTRAAVAGARRVANPGCYATAVELGLAPLLAAGVIEAEDIVVVAGSGTTGAGRSPTVNLLGSEVMGDLTTYKVGGVHQHLAEMRQTLSAVADTPVSMSFTPMLVPMPRDRHRRDRQPRQGRGRSGDPECEPHARAGRDHRVADQRDRIVSE
jgi:N-acetyl-gamma-glutamyl-phosphate reductase